MNIDQEKPNEEIANWLTHGLGLCLSIAGFYILINAIHQDDGYTKMISVTVYGITLILLYVFSTLYHAVKSDKLKRKLQIADHAAIYIKIAGTYTPFSLLTLKDNYGWALLVMIWVLAIAGVIFKFIFSDKYNIASTIIYLIMGWLAIIVIKPLFNNLPLEGFILLAAGGLSYTVGVIFFLWEKLPYSHPIWHIFVMAGSTLHYLSIFLLVV